RSLPAAPARRGLVRRAAAHARRAAARAAPVRGGAAGARGVPQAHHPSPARPVPWRARRARVPPGPERGCAPARSRLVAGAGGACDDRTRREGSGMITRDAQAFLDFARGCAPDFGPATAKAAFLVSPDGFSRADESASDNRYMADAGGFDAARALDQHRGLQAALSGVLPTLCFPGFPDAPDGLFPNNVFATAPGRLVVGRMRHPVRRREAARDDIRGFFRDVLGYAETDLSTQPHACELTGALVIDRARGLGFCGLSERC